ncbi:Glucosamine--fructose-6-phosphate aminotransferase 1 [Mactra antiquata]
MRACEEFLVVHNGIITNYKDIKSLLEHKGFTFESETDTEVIAKLAKHVYDTYHHDGTFRQIVEIVIQQLEGAFALAFMSTHFPGECVATRRGSPLVIGVKTKSKLSTDHIPVFYSKGKFSKLGMTVLYYLLIEVQGVCGSIYYVG